MLWMIFRYVIARIVRFITKRGCLAFGIAFILYHIFLFPTMLSLLNDGSIETHPQYLRLLKISEQLRIENIELRREMQKSYGDIEKRFLEEEKKVRKLAKNFKPKENLSLSENTITNEFHDEEELLAFANGLRLKVSNMKHQLSKIMESTSSSSRSLKYEVLSRRISNQLQEMWFLWRGNLKAITRALSRQKISTGFLDKITDDYRELHQITERDFEELIAMDGIKEIKDQLAIDLSEKIQRRIYKLQNPSDCSSAKKVVLYLNKPCGYGCQMHHLMYGMIVAYATKRTLIVPDPIVGKETQWSSLYKELTNCTVSPTEDTAEWSYENINKKVVTLPYAEFISPRPKQMPMAVPKDISDELAAFHSRPFIWWIGQICKFLFRHKPFLSDEINRKKEQLKFKRPIVGIHVRRTDKINSEASYHGIDEYMYWVDLYYKKLELSGSFNQRRVFIASDDTTILKEASERYPNYLFLHDETASNSAGVNDRFSTNSIHGIISDVELLSDCDFLVCTFSSQVCRLAYEIMSYKHTDASQRFRSLDDIYYFGGQNQHVMRVLWPNKKTSSKELKLEVGDTIKIAGNHWDGKSLGRNIITQESGLFFSYKVEDIQSVEDFPDYSD